MKKWSITEVETLDRGDRGMSVATRSSEVMRDDEGRWSFRQPDQDWQALDGPHDVEVYEGLRAVGLA